MSNFAANLASLARYKLQSSLASGSRDSLSLHRWVLLKNSITRDDYPTNATSSSSIVTDTTEVEFDEDADPDIEECMFAYLFPDPGDALDSQDDEVASEAQWLDSVLETLGDDEDEDIDLAVKVHVIPVDSDEHSQSDTDSPVSSPDEDYSPTSTVDTSYPVTYIPFHPPLALQFDSDSHHDYFFAAPRSSVSPYHDIDGSFSSVPDAIEDTSSDDESEAPATPFTRSRSSLHLVDPASVPLPHDGPDPHIYNASDELFSFEVDPHPNADSFDESRGFIYSPYHQNC